MLRTHSLSLIPVQSGNSLTNWLRWLGITIFVISTALALGWLSSQVTANAAPNAAQPALSVLAVQAAPQTWRGVFDKDAAKDLAFAFQTTDGSSIHAAGLIATIQADSETRWEVATTRADTTFRVAAREIAPGILRMDVTPSTATRAVEFTMPARVDEHFYGLGERFTGLDLAGQVVENWAADMALEQGQEKSYSPMPFLLSSRGYGLLLDTHQRSTFDLEPVRAGYYSVRVESAHLALYLIAGPHPQTILERHTQLVGRPPLVPAWALGVWKNLIGGQARVESDVKRLRDAQVPLDAIWLYDTVDEASNWGWRWQVHGPIRNGAYPNLKAMIQNLHAQNLKVLGYNHPFVYPNTPAFDEAAQQKLLIERVDGKPYIEAWDLSPRAYLDFTNPRATAWWQAKQQYALTELGFDGAMQDFGEAAPVAAQYADGTRGEVMHNQYPMLYLRAGYNAAQAVKPDDFVFFARSGARGSQPYTTGRFTGDQVRSWDKRRGIGAVIPAMIHGGISGWTYWGPDIGGFFEHAHDANESAAQKTARLQAEKELWLRWVRLGALSPIMRDMLGAQRDPVGVFTDEETLAVFRAYARLHTALKPYLHKYAQVAHARGIPILRPLFLNYPAEHATYTLDDEYMLGDDLLVAPVIEQGQTQRRVYLPAGEWRNYWTGELYPGQRWVSVDAPLYQIPLFVRGGATLELPQPDELF